MSILELFWRYTVIQFSCEILRIKSFILLFVKFCVYAVCLVYVMFSSLFFYVLVE